MVEVDRKQKERKRKQPARFNQKIQCAQRTPKNMKQMTKNNIIRKIDKINAHFDGDGEWNDK